jgi:uncharacterized coiled-coil DUF342 family protein
MAEERTRVAEAAAEASRTRAAMARMGEERDVARKERDDIHDQLLEARAERDTLQLHLQVTESPCSAARII